MNRFIEQYVERVLKQRRRRIVQTAVLVVMSVFVALTVLFALMMNGEGQAKTTYCGIEEHIHADSCISKTLICQNDGTDSHTHSDDCYQTTTTLSCSDEEHTHSADCYNDGALVCDKTEHNHTDDCFKEEKVLVCTAEEGTPEVHTHTDDCYKTEYICGVSVAHKHTEGCYINPEESEEEAVSTAPKTKKSKAKAASATVGEVPNPQSPKSTIINLFDYRANMNSDDWNENGDDYKTTYCNSGINKGKYLKFDTQRETRPTAGTANWWTGNTNPGVGSETPGAVLQGIVQKKLVDGYPFLAGGAVDNNTTPASLDYLFNEQDLYADDEKQYKRSYTNVKDLLRIDKDGYYYYNSSENYACYDKTDNRFKVYEQPAITGEGHGGQFFPFNSIESVENETKATDNYNLNHYFGMTITSRFVQQNNGYSDPEKKKPITFKFSGDDDVWIFIDDVLVADLGGIHLPASVNIDFAEGEVYIETVCEKRQDNTYYKDKKTTYFKDIFADYSHVELDNTQKTLKDGTSHTLKFFYLERGGNVSNLSLKFNLTEIPPTGIYKVDQFGAKLANAQFDIYKAEKNESGEWFYMAYDNSAIPASVINNPDYVTAEDGKKQNIFYDGKTINSLYHGTTDENGEMVFVNAEGMPLGTDEIKSLFGDNFILREVHVPDGYRTVADEVFMYFDNEQILVDDVYGTGVWSSPNANVTASQTLHVAKSSYEVASTMKDSTSYLSGNETDGYTIDYYDPNKSDANGTLFAVVLKRNGNDQNAKDFDQLHFQTWDPIWGNDEIGYQYVESTGQTNLNDVVTAAQKQAEISGNKNVFSLKGSGMQITFEDLPGDPTRYYSYMVDHKDTVDPTEPQYLVAYYWTSAGSIGEATATNTVRVASRENTINGSSDNGIDVHWSSTIEVPNIENRLFFQKKDKNNNLINNAVFALYNVGEEENGEIYYIANDGNTHIYLEPDTNGDNKGTAYTKTDTGQLSGTYEINIANNIDEQFENLQNTSGYINDPTGNITVSISNTTYTIEPVKDTEGKRLVAFTHSVCDTVNEDGTGHFGMLPADNRKYYVLREIYAPPGFVINPAEVKVVIRNDGVYANAGEADNNVSVGNGAGYLARTLDVFASEGSIDETLTWIYSALRIDSVYKTFAKFDPNSDNLNQYVRHDSSEPSGFGSATTSELSQAMVTYLRYDPEMQSSLFDYRPSTSQEAREEGKTATYMILNQDGTVKNKETLTLAEQEPFPTTMAGEGTMRLFTNHGWSALSVYQDYSFGSVLGAQNKKTYYENLNGKEISHLFSNSTFIQVTDESVVDLTIIKHGSETAGAGTVYLDNAEFTLAKKNGENNLYYDPAKKDFVEVQEGKAPPVLRTLTDRETERKSYIKIPDLLDGEYILTETKAPDGYKITDGPWTIVVGAQEVVNEKGQKAITYMTIDGNPAQEMSNDSPYYTRNPRSYQYEMTVSNTPDAAFVNLHIRKQGVKVSGGTQSESPLSGAEFVLYKNTGNNNEYRTYLKGYDNESYPTWTTNKSDAKIFTSKGNNALFDITNLSAGEYYLMETKAPDGYNILTEPVQIKITTKKNDTGYDTDVSVNNTANASITGTGSEITVKNFAGYMLPNTGGSGTTIYIIIGLTAVSISIISALIIYRKRNKD